MGLIHDWQVPMMRLFALFSHFILTTGLVWTRVASIQVGMTSYKEVDYYRTSNSSYIGMISTALACLIVESVFLGYDNNNVTLSSMIHLFLDIVACFFNAWMILDGLVWYNYSYIFVFCVLLPTIYDILVALQYRVANTIVSRRTSPIATNARRLYHYVFNQPWTMFKRE